MATSVVKYDDFNSDTIESIQFGIVDMGTGDTEALIEKQITYEDRGKIPSIIVGAPQSYEYFEAHAWAARSGLTRTRAIMYIHIINSGNKGSNFYVPYLLVYTK